MKTVYVWPIFILVLFVGCASINTPQAREIMNFEEISNTILAKDKRNIDNAFLLNPFNLFYEKSDIHVMLYFNDHPKYESVEAMISDNDTKDIRVIITKHDQTQIDYINNQEKVNRLLQSRINRDVYYAQIDYTKNINNSKPEVSLQFQTIDNEQVDFEFVCVAKPSKKYAGLTNPEGHSATISIPVMYQDLSTLASSKSSIEIDGIKYQIPVLIDIPIFFKGMKGYYSENFKMGIIRTGELDIQIVQSPVEYKVGEKWIYKKTNKLCEYTISKIENNYITINSLNEKITGVLINGNIGILEINISPVNKESSMVISFEKPLFNNLNSNAETGFAISIDDNKNLITGTIQYESDGGEQNYNLLPSNPSWATNRKMYISITKNKHEINWNGKIDFQE